MKVIDLLQKIANGEIKEEFEFVTKGISERFKVLIKDYYVEIVNENGTNLFHCKNLNILDTEIEIIEEDKPIEKIKPISNDLNFANHYTKENAKSNLRYVADKINELVRAVNKLNERGKEE